MTAVNFEDLVKMQEHSGGFPHVSSPMSVPHSGTVVLTKVKPPVMVVQHWNWKSDPTGWYASEKFDGCRAWWDGTNLVSRQGNVFAAPAWFRDALPRMPLDGELWLGRGRFSETVGVSRGGNDQDWKGMRYLVFDAPMMFGSFEIRLCQLHAEVQLSGCPWVEVVAQQRVTSRYHLLGLLEGVEGLGGEGMVLRRAGSPYTAGDSQDAQKVIRVRTAEAIIIGYTRGTGNRAGGCGSLQCRLPNGIEFKVGTGLRTKDVENPPPVGTRITFAYKCLTPAGVPREPRYVRIRDDL